MFLEDDWFTIVGAVIIRTRVAIDGKSVRWWGTSATSDNRLLKLNQVSQPILPCVCTS